VADLLPYVAEQSLVDHHCHGVLRRDADVATLESMLSEGAGFPGGSVFDSQAGFMFRRLRTPNWTTTWPGGPNWAAPR
jgi:hypothetical protein